MKNFMAKLKVLFAKVEGGVSFTKIWAWVTAVIFAVVALQAQLTAVGVTISPELLPWFKGAAIASALITVIRARDAASSKG